MSILKTLSIPTAALFCMSSAPQNNNQLPSETKVKQMEVLKDLTDGSSTSIEELNKGWSEKTFYHETSIQRSIDSLAYKKILDGTQLAKDSSVVKEFNSISAAMAPASSYGMHTQIENEYESKLLKMGIDRKEIYKFRGDCMRVHKKNKYGDLCCNIDTHKNYLARYQYKTDSVAYNRFFQKHNLLNKDVVKQMTMMAKKIKP